MIEVNTGRNPVLPPNIHIADPEAHVMPDGRLYVYGSLDERGDIFCSDRYCVVSTADLRNWHVHHDSFHSANVMWSPNTEPSDIGSHDAATRERGIARATACAAQHGLGEKFQEFKDMASCSNPPRLLFAPDAIAANGRYFLYFCLSDDTEGVAVSDSPEGPFTDPIRLPVSGIDPAIFVDRDGQAYYYWGQFHASGAKLAPTLTEIDESTVIHKLLTEDEAHFHEGSSMRRIGDRYYYVFADSSRGKPTCLGYATSTSPLGPFIYRGIIIDNVGADPSSWNNHGSIEEVDGRWYVFYHRPSQNSPLHRRLRVEPITIAADGAITEVKMTSQGVGDPFRPGEEIEAWRACTVLGGMYIGLGPDGHERLLNAVAGSKAEFRYIQSDLGFSRATLRTSGHGTIQVFANGVLAGVTQVYEGEVTELQLVGIGSDRYELELHVIEGSSLTIWSVTLY